MTSTPDQPTGFATGVAQVAEVDWLTPRLRHVRISAPELRTMDIGVGPAPAVRLLLPPADSPVVMPTVTIDGLAYPPGTEPPTPRTLTIRRHDAVRGTLDVEVAAHPHGVLGRWAATTAPGDEVGFAGPRHFRTLPADGPLVLLGDESACAAIATIAESVRGDGRTDVTALVEVGSRADRLDLGDSVTWCERGARTRGLALVESVATLDLAGGPFVWVAGEARMVRTARSLLEARGLAPDRVRACGYWRAGTSSTEIDDALLEAMQALTSEGSALDPLDEFALLVEER